MSIPGVPELPKDVAEAIEKMEAELTSILPDHEYPMEFPGGVMKVKGSELIAMARSVVDVKRAYDTGDEGAFKPATLEALRRICGCALSGIAKQIDEDEYEIFQCDFDGGARCTMKVPRKAPDEGRYSAVLCEWSGEIKPSAKLLHSYVEWSKGVYSHAAERWGMAMTVAFQKDGVQELWTFEPGKTPRRGL